MPELSEISYSQSATVSAVRDYYQFLTKFYLKESDVIEPPAGGWPNLRTNLESLEKSDEVYSLLSHLPYIREPSDDRDKAMGGPWVYFADWQQLGQSASDGGLSSEELKALSEKIEDVPSHIVSLTFGPQRNQVFLLDTKLGIVHWRECNDDIKDKASRELIEDDPDEYASEAEAEWIAEGGSWAIQDFFQMLEDQFRELNFVPTSERTVIDVYDTWGTQSSQVVPLLQDIYREHGWPGQDGYNKEECLRAVKTALKEDYPDYADGLPDE